MQKQAATFFVRTEGESMLGAGQDRNLRPEQRTGGEALEAPKRAMVLEPENPAYPDIVLGEELETVIWAS